MPSAGSVAAAAALLQPTPHARQLVRDLARIDHASQPLSREEAEQWKKNLALLIQQGADGATAIAEFLRTNTDVVFGRAGREFLGFESARAAFFDALLRIGGPQAVSATLEALQNGADPREIALLAQNLDKLAPDVYRHEAIGAARDVLAIAEQGKLAGFDVAPLFEVFQNYGGSEVVADLEQAARHYEYYSAIALANLPDGSGIPSLVEMSRGSGKATTTALQLLAQLSSQYGTAAAGLTDLVRAEGIPAQSWPLLATALAGNEYHFQNSAFFGERAHPGNVSIAHVSAGNQSFYNAFNPGTLTQEQFKSRLGFIDQLRAVTSQPDALQALQQAADLLVRRLPSVAVVSP
jgi:hypothetical protein